MINMSQSSAYIALCAAIKQLQQELTEAQQYGDDVQPQITQVTIISERISKLGEQRPWEAIGVSRATYYRDQRRLDQRRKTGA